MSRQSPFATLIAAAVIAAATAMSLAATAMVATAGHGDRVTKSSALASAALTRDCRVTASRGFDPLTGGPVTTLTRACS